MDLATHQRTLLGLFRSTYRVSAADDAYIQRVAQSRDLHEARISIFMWRIYVLERTCPLTFALLKRRNLLKSAVEDFIARTNISPFRETQAPDFLAGLGEHDDRLVVSVAQFELALLKVRQGDARCHVVRWNVEPHEILNALAREIPLEGEIPAGDYEIIVSGHFPSQLQIVAIHADTGQGALRA
jgi:hypothetical protein